ncbi:MAG: tail fiber protein [Bacteroidota bacterium]
MSDQFIGEIRMFGCNFPPVAWAQCNGQLLSISQNTALFSLLGTYYGGNGVTTFGLPNLQGRAALDQGHGSGLSEYPIGVSGGAPAVTLGLTQMPAHTHSALGSTAANNANPTGLTWANPTGRPAPNYFANAVGTPQPMNQQALAIAGNSQAHNNLMPYQVVNFCIAVQGTFPQRP